MMNKFVKNPSRYKPDHFADAQIIRAIGLVPEGYQEQWKGPAGVVPWEHVTLYEVVDDGEGIPYCTSEGLSRWAEYVATQKDTGRAQQFYVKPDWNPYGGWVAMAAMHAPETHRKPGDPAKSLMRVWVQKDKGKDNG